jgi:hypothetical protein
MEKVFPPRSTVRNKARVEGCIVEAFTCKEIANISSMYFSHANNVNDHMAQYRMVEEVLLIELKIRQWKGKGVGATSAYFIMDEEGNHTMLYMYTNMEEVTSYFDKFDKTYWNSLEQPTIKQLDHMHWHEIKGGPSFAKWFCTHVIYLLILFFPICSSNIIFFPKVITPFYVVYARW